MAEEKYSDTIAGEFLRRFALWQADPPDPLPPETERILRTAAAALAVMSLDWTPPDGPVDPENF